MSLLDIPYCGIGLGHRLADQPGGQQYVAPVVTEEWRRHVQQPVARGGIIEEGKCRRKVSRPECGPSPVEHRMGSFQLLAGFGEQASGGHEVSVRESG